MDTELTLLGKNIGKYRRWFRDAVDAANTGRKEAQEDFEFVSGKQWTDNEVKAFESQGRPAINLCKKNSTQ